VTKRWAGGLEL